MFVEKQFLKAKKVDQTDQDQLMENKQAHLSVQTDQCLLKINPVGQADQYFITFRAFEQENALQRTLSTVFDHCAGLRTQGSKSIVSVKVLFLRGQQKCRRHDSGCGQVNNYAI